MLISHYSEEISFHDTSLDKAGIQITFFILFYGNIRASLCDFGIHHMLKAVLNMHGQINFGMSDLNFEIIKSSALFLPCVYEQIRLDETVGMRRHI